MSANQANLMPPINSTTATGVNTVNGFDPMCFPANFQQTENRMIYPVPDVRFRPLPFYDLISEVIRPAGLISDGVIGRANESQLDFQLSIDQADMLAMSVGSKQILLRFCYLDKTIEQDDNFPPEVVISVNNNNIALPPAISNPNKPNIPPKRPGQHVDITKFCKLCPFVQNVLKIKWFVDPLEPSRSYVLNVIVAEKVTSEILLQRIKERGLMDPEITKKLVVDSDNEVATTNLQSTLFCPLGKMRMSIPCKSVSCHHIPCFDALIYLQMNEKKAQWTCPVCYKPAYFNDLMIDGFFMSVLEKADSNVTEVTLHSDGTWSPVLKVEQPTSARNPPPEVITISDDDDD